MKLLSKIFIISFLIVISGITNEIFGAAKKNAALDAIKAKLEHAFVEISSNKCLVPNGSTMVKVLEPWVNVVSKDVTKFVTDNSDADGKAAFGKLDAINKDLINFLQERVGANLKIQYRAIFEEKLRVLNENHQILVDMLNKKRSGYSLPKRGDVIELLIDLNQDLFSLMSRAYNDPQRYDKNCNLK
jgi:hypothetical protein